LPSWLVLKGSRRRCARRRKQADNFRVERQQWDYSGGSRPPVEARINSRVSRKMLSAKFLSHARRESTIPPTIAAAIP
jgi:hypothetical protein